MNEKRQERIIDGETYPGERNVNGLADEIARSIGALEYWNGMMKFSCEQYKWNDEVVCTVNEAILHLGVALAALHGWKKDLEQGADDA